MAAPPDYIYRFIAVFQQKGDFDSSKKPKKKKAKGKADSKATQSKKLLSWHETEGAGAEVQP